MNLGAIPFRYPTVPRRSQNRNSMCVHIEVIRCGSRILVRGAQWSFDPKRGEPWEQNLLKIRGFPLKLPENCMILKKSSGLGGPLDPLLCHWPGNGLALFQVNENGIRMCLWASHVHPIVARCPKLTSTKMWSAYRVQICSTQSQFCKWFPHPYRTEWIEWPLQ